MTGLKYQTITEIAFTPILIRTTTFMRNIPNTINTCGIRYYSHFIGHLLSRYRRISDCSYSIVYGQAGRYAP